MKYLVVLLVLLCIALAAGLMQYKTENKHLKDNVQHISDSVTHWVDNYGTEHTQNKLLVAQSKDINTLWGKYADSIEKRLKIKENQIIGLQKVLSETQGKFVVQLQHDSTFIHDTLFNEDDTIPAQSSIFQYSDGYLKELGEIYHDSVHVRYEVNTPITITEYYKRKWFLGKKQYFIDGFCENKNVNIYGLKGIQVAKHKPLNGLKIGVGIVIGLLINKL